MKTRIYAAPAVKGLKVKLALGESLVFVGATWTITPHHSLVTAELGDIFHCPSLVSS